MVRPDEWARKWVVEGLYRLQSDWQPWTGSFYTGANVDRGGKEMFLVKNMYIRVEG